jgi:hypothetical protein
MNSSALFLMVGLGLGLGLGLRLGLGLGLRLKKNNGTDQMKIIWNVFKNKNKNSNDIFLKGFFLFVDKSNQPYL